MIKFEYGVNPKMPFFHQFSEPFFTHITTQVSNHKNFLSKFLYLFGAEEVYHDGLVFLVGAPLRIARHGFDVLFQTSERKSIG